MFNNVRYGKSTADSGFDRELCWRWLQLISTRPNELREKIMFVWYVPLFKQQTFLGNVLDIKIEFFKKLEHFYFLLSL